jgi:hypothetical protein
MVNINSECPPGKGEKLKQFVKIYYGNIHGKEYE